VTAPGGEGDQAGPDGPGDDEPCDERRAAAELERAHPGFVIVWGSFSRQFVAFPLFGPPGTHFSAANPRDLERLMGQAEQRYRNRTEPR
jgi:hypothetical protein